MVGEKQFLVEELGDGFAGRKRFDNGRPEETLAERALGVDVDQQHVEPVAGQRSGKMKAGRTLPATALLVDQADGNRSECPLVVVLRITRRLELQRAIPPKSSVSLPIRWHSWSKVVKRKPHSTGAIGVALLWCGP